LYYTGLFSYIEVSFRTYTRDSTCNEVRPEYNMCIKTNLCIKRALNNVNSDLYIRKEIYVYKKRPVHMKIDVCARKETYICKKKRMYAKRHLFMRKENIYIHVGALV